jgi:large subunit ribosomal protein L26e
MGVGASMQIGISPSKVLVTKLYMDKDRKAMLERKDRSKKSKGKEVAMEEVSNPGYG